MSTDLALPADVRAELVTERASSEEMLHQIDAMIIATAEDLEFAEGVLEEVKRIWHVREERRTRITGPLNAAKREVDALFSPVLKPLKWAEDKLKAKIGAYTLARNKASEDAMAAVAAGDVSVAFLAPVVHSSGVSVREELDYEVVDFDALPDEYKQINHTAVITALKGMSWPTCHIPGLSIKKRAAVRVGGSR